jgi:hypothetical protein
VGALASENIPFGQPKPHPVATYRAASGLPRPHPHWVALVSANLRATSQHHRQTLIPRLFQLERLEPHPLHLAS